MTVRAGPAELARAHHLVLDQADRIVMAHPFSAAPLGYMVDLHTVWRFASHWYDGRLDRGYVRREPGLAKGDRGINLRRAGDQNTQE